MQPETIKLMGGTLSVDFANSTDWTAGGESIEAEDALLEPDAVERWGRRLGVFGAPAAGDDASADGGPAAGDHSSTARGDAAARELAELRRLRPLLRSVLIAAAGGEAAPPAALDAVMRTYAEAVAAARLAEHGGVYRLDWAPDDLRRVRYAVVADALALLADAERLGRVHVCPGRNCGWLFLNTSGRRRWCSMQTCGSRAKMRAMYARRHAA
jgi:predicted RNA-binding Zn ribbon-like protein